MHLVHGTCIAIDGAAALLCGPSGAGKSDLALRAILAGAVLVADDQVALEASDGQVIAAAPPAIAGRLEVRGVGILAVPHLSRAPLALVVELVAPDRVERLPPPRTVELGGKSLPTFRLAAFEASAAAKLIMAVRAVRHHLFRHEIGRGT
jgi:serine kinase of HPr protein (carbohydrate metabolism regulator)